MLTCIAKIKDLAYGRNIINLGLLIIFIAWFLTPLQDYFHAIRNQHAYYISESLLFATFWFWIIPVSLFVLRITWLNSPKINFFTKISVFVISSFVLHLLAYALFVYGISYFFYQATYDIPKILSYSLSNDFYKYIIIYGMIGYYFL